MQISMSLQERIIQAEKLPRNGSLDRMVQVKRIKQALVGFTDAQKSQYIIVEYGNTFVTSNGTTWIMVTLDNEMILTWADIINERSINGEIDMSECDIYQTIVEAANSIRNESIQEL